MGQQIGKITAIHRQAWIEKPMNAMLPCVRPNKTA